MLSKTKQQKPNGFMVFTLDWRNKYGKSMSIPEATAEAGRIWKTMDAEQRAPYIKQAKGGDMVVGNNVREKLTCTGAPLSLVEKERYDQETKELQAKRDIENIIRKSVQKGQFEWQSHFFIMANYFTKTMRDGVYVPAEIAVCRFSLRDGVQEVYQTLINPGFNIYGHRYEAQHHSDTTHGLPLPPNAMGDTNLGKIYNDILDFIRFPDSDKYSPVYTHRDCIHIVESILDFLKTDSEANNIDVKVYSIQHLLFTMKKVTCEAGEIEKPTSFYITDAYFDRDFFEFHSGIGCQFHEDKDKCKYCTQSYVTRWGFMFADYMCHDIAIALVPGRHCPENTNVNAIVTPAPSEYTDRESFVSFGTTSTNLTKPIAGSKIYYDDQKNILPDASKTYNINFPALGEDSAVCNARKNALALHCSIKSKNATYSFDADELVDCGSFNPWSMRSRNVPKEPLNSHFDTNYTQEKFDSDADESCSVISFGRGRISFLDSSFSTIGASSYGRGRYMRP
ncbi:protein maelstrom 1 [Stomoxys calcitrans]|uniref:HMG box domain-containing protein n=1 Tax=Stomoxys calcitrans TaxID=35570 RepID=A0A1I8Q0K2_STOCA|nr:protein maelstrom 1 [Stomoxys calcitrans]